MKQLDLIEPVALAPAPAPAPAPPKPPFVAICVPSGRTWESRTATAVAGVSTFSALHGVQLAIINLEGSMIAKQRNDLVELARQTPISHILFVDTDMVFPPDALMRLLKHDKDIVGATYNKRVPPYETLGKLKGDKPSEAELSQGGLREAEQLPGGMLLIKASVFERLKWPWFFETYQWPGDTGTEALKEYLRNNYHHTPPEDVLASLEGTALSAWLDEVHAIENSHKWSYYSEDLNFCRKVIKNGLTLWCDLGLTFDTEHLGTLPVTCKPPHAAATASAVMDAVM